MKNNYVVRLVLPDGIHDIEPPVRTLLALQARVGIVAVHRDDKDGMCFDLLPPAGTEDSKAWADETAAIFEGCCYNAVRAPECPCDEVAG